MTTYREYSSNHSPALAGYQENLRLAWTAKSNQLNVVSLDSHDFPFNQNPLNEFSYHGPTFAVFGDQLFIAWTGTDEYAQLNVMSSTDGMHFGNKVTIPQDSRYGPALAAFGGRLYIAWTGVDNASLLNVMSSADGQNWDPKTKSTLGEDSVASPALVAISDPNAVGRDFLYLAWTGTDHPHHLNLIRSSDGNSFNDKAILSKATVPAWATVPDDVVSSGGPALLSHWIQASVSGSEQLYSDLIIAWTGTEGDQPLSWTSSTELNLRPTIADGLGKSIYESTDNSVAGPALGQISSGINNDAYIAWAGTDDLNVQLMSALVYE